MRPDTYTKVILTIIATCLLIQVVQSVMFGQLRVKAQAPTDVNLIGVTKRLANDSGNALRVHVVNPITDPVHVKDNR